MRNKGYFGRVTSKRKRDLGGWGVSLLKIGSTPASRDSLRLVGHDVILFLIGAESFDWC